LKGWQLASRAKGKKVLTTGKTIISAEIKAAVLKKIKTAVLKGKQKKALAKK